MKSQVVTNKMIGSGSRTDIYTIMAEVLQITTLTFIISCCSWFRCTVHTKIWNRNTRNRLIQSSGLPLLTWDWCRTPIFTLAGLSFHSYQQSSKISPRLRQRRSVLMQDHRRKSTTIIRNINPSAADTWAHWLIVASDTPPCPLF